MAGWRRESKGGWFWSRIGCWGMLMLVGGAEWLSGVEVVAAPPQRASRGHRPAASGASITPRRLAAMVDRYFRTRRDYRDGDLIHRRDVVQVLAWLKKAGWEPAEAKEIEESALPANDFLVQLFSKPAGRRFMRKVASYKLIYDRLDRIARVPGGRRMLADVVRLPDGERYAAWRPQRGAPDLLDLLPKRGNGRKRHIKDYERPTGRIYTAGQLKDRLMRQLRDGTAD